ncbi:MAG: hypothetical protein ACAI44_10765 [Candidatus Sericytochromatia bacterium]
MSMHWEQIYWHAREMMALALAHLPIECNGPMVTGPPLLVDCQLATERFRARAAQKGLNVSQLTKVYQMEALWSNLVTQADYGKHMRTKYAVALADLLGVDLLVEPTERARAADLLTPTDAGGLSG